MARLDAKLARGQYHVDGSSSGAGGNEELVLGCEVEFADVDPTTANVNTVYSGLPVRCRLVRNNSGIALLPGRSLAPSTTAAKNRIHATGYTTTDAEASLGIVDEYLPAAGVPDQAIFWAVQEGPGQVLSDLAGGANNLIPVGTVLVALTAATSGATTAGRVAPQVLTGATAVLAGQIQNRLGRAMSAKTTANTNAMVRVLLTKW